jgi:hypothetical protein
MQVNAAEAHIKLLEVRLAEHANLLSVPSRAPPSVTAMRAPAVQPSAQAGCQDDVASAPPMYREMLATMQEGYHSRGDGTMSDMAEVSGAQAAPDQASASPKWRFHGAPIANVSSNTAVGGHQFGKAIHTPDGQLPALDQWQGRRDRDTGRRPMAELSNGNRDLLAHAGNVMGRQRPPSTSYDAAQAIAMQSGLAGVHFYTTQSPSGKAAARSAAARQHRAGGTLTAMERMQRLHEKLKQREKDVQDRMSRIIGYS